MVALGFGLEVSQNRYLSTSDTAVDAILTITAGDSAVGGPAVAAEAILLDCSGSMSAPPTKIAAARRAACAAVDALRDGTLFAIVQGTDHAEMCYPATAHMAVADATTRAEAKRQINRLTASGGTSMGTWLTLARELLAEHPTAIRHAVLLTDGQNMHETPEELDRVLAECDGHFFCDARGIGEDWDPHELRRIVTVLRGTADSVRADSDLVDDFRALAQAAMAKVVPDARIRVTTMPGAELRLLKQVFPRESDFTGNPVRQPETENGRTVWEFSTGSWAANESRDYQLSLGVDQGERDPMFEDLQVAVIELVARPAGADDTAERCAPPKPVLVHWTTDAALSSRFDPKVAHYSGQAELHRAALAGFDAYDAGRLDEAERAWGVAVRLATESGNTELLTRLERLVDIADASRGIVRIKPGLSRSDLLHFGVGSTISGRFSADPPREGTPPIDGGSRSVGSIGAPPPYTGVRPPDEVGTRRAGLPRGRPRRAASRGEGPAPPVRSSSPADVLGYGGPPSGPDPGSAAAERYVTCVVWTGEKAFTGPYTPVPPGVPFVVGVGVGAPEPMSVLREGATFPDDVIGPGARRLGVYARQVDRAADPGRHGYLYLPPAGDAFTCPVADRLPDGTRWELVDHAECATHHGRHVEFSCPPLAAGEVATFDVLVYVGAAAVHKQVLEISTLAEAGVLSRTTYRLTRFARLPDLTDRVVSIDDGADRLTINHLGPSDGLRAGARTFGFRVSAAQWSGAAAAFRKLLTDIYFIEAADGTWTARHAAGRRIDHDEYVDALRRTAVVGRSLYNNLFPTAESRALPTLLRHEAAVHGRPATVQVARTAARPFVIPWQAVYDLPMEHRDDDLRHCPSVERFGPAKGMRPVPPHCPEVAWHEAARTADSRPAVLCPFGFWGLAHVLEVPEPPPNRDLDAIVSDRLDATAAVTGAGGTLDQTALAAHVRRLKQIPGFGDQNVITTARRLRDELAESTMDIVYLLCHAERAPSTAVVAPTLRLEFEDCCVTNDDIATWSRDEWDVRHWSDRHPLVILNACQTSEVVQSSMATFVSTFMGAGASGVIGSETLLEQTTAAHAMEVFLREFCTGAPVGPAIRAMRWDLLATGSLLGLAYTPYCSADLRLRDHRA